MDNGTDRFRGVYLHGNERARDLFARWMAPLRDLKMDTRTHHSNLDVYDRLVPEDLRKNGVILATFLYHAAMSDKRVPREEN